MSMFGDIAVAIEMKNILELMKEIENDPNRWEMIKKKIEDIIYTAEHGGL